jgi:uncharacterized membrane protein YeaQ/YmgE (transglycosylase-associated protein family)
VLLSVVVGGVGACIGSFVTPMLCISFQSTREAMKVRFHHRSPTGAD